MNRYTPRRKVPVAERLWAKTQPAGNGCLLWTGTVNTRGYPQISVQGKVLMATKIAWRLHHGYEPSRPVLQHCGNRLCLAKQCLYEKPEKIGEATGGKCKVPGPCRTCGEMIERGQPYTMNSNNHRIRHHARCVATVPDYSGPEYQYDPSEPRELAQCQATSW